jgi:hypothetical protein
MRTKVLFVAFSLLFAACGDDDGTVNPDAPPGTPDAPPTADAAPGTPDAMTGCNPVSDADGDGLSNELEGCLNSPEDDHDGDGVPDWMDPDSDNDGVNDGLEDRNGDGNIGNCLDTCAGPADCGAGEWCSTGQCVSFVCADGETDPYSADTDGDGLLDGVEATFICNPRSEDNPNGLKPFKTVNSASAITYSTPDWQVALEPEAFEGLVTITAAEAQDSAFLFDLTDPAIELAGFIVTRAATPADSSAVRAAQGAIEDLRPGALTGVTQQAVRSSGVRRNSLDGYDSVLGTTLGLTTGLTDVTALRALVVTKLSGHAPAEVMFPPVGWTGASENQYIVVFQTMLRPELSQIVHMGAVVRLEAYDDRSVPTGYHADDLANGTALARSENGTTVECEQFLTDQNPKADIIWVLDESGSMSDDLANVATNSTTLFNYASTAGLDFRMGVTDMSPAINGMFASRMTGTSTGDRWLLPTELTTFQANIQDPSGPDFGFDEYGLTMAQAAITRHTPRDAADAAKVRPDAELVVILVSDEHPQELENADIFPEGDPAPATPDQLSDTITEIKPMLDVYEEHDIHLHAIVVPEPWPACSGGGGEIGYGYIDAVNWFGGLVGSLCQPDLGATMQAIIDDVLGDASPIVLEWVPISATISVARDGVIIPRSRENGWDFAPAANSIVFHGLPFTAGVASEIVVSYQRWSEQVPIE